MESLLWTALSNAVIATVLAATVAAIARFYRRPAVLHALWLLVLLKLITPPLVPVTFAWQRPSDALPAPEKSAFDIREPPSFQEPSKAEPDEPLTEPAFDAPPLVPQTNVSMTAVLLTIWLFGSLAWWTIAGVRLLRFHRLLRGARIAPEDVRAQTRHLAVLLGLRRCPRISFISSPISPMLLALGFSPRLLLPADLWACLSTEQQDTLLAHELAHLRRGDHWIRRLEFLVLGLYWWHPVVWWARRRLQEVEEECCDLRVVAVLPSAAAAYASALLETVTFLSQTRPAALLGASGAGQVPLLKRRLTMILTANPSRKSSRVGFWVAFGLGGLLLPLTLGAAQTEPPARDQTPPREEREGQPDEHRLVDFIRVLPLDKVHQTSCMSCHQNVAHSQPEVPFLHGRWDAHDGYVREYKRWLEQKKAQAPQSSVGKSESEGERARAEQIEQLQDEIELLKVQVRLKEAQKEGIKTLLDEAKSKYERMLAQSATIPNGQIMDARTAWITQQSQLRIKEAELQEPLVRLKQAERRLARLKGQTKPAVDPTRPGSEQRLRDLEKKLNQILEEMKVLQQDMRRPKSDDSPRRQPNRP